MTFGLLSVVIDEASGSAESFVTPANALVIRIFAASPKQKRRARIAWVELMVMVNS